MLSVFDQGAPAPCPARFNLAAHVLAEAGARADKTALAVLAPSGADRWSYERLARAVRGTAAGFLDRGLAPGDRVLLRLGNSVDFPIAYLGALWAGMVPVPSSSQLTAPEVSVLIAATRPAAIVRGAGIACPDPDGAQLLDTGWLHTWCEAPGVDAHMGDPDRPGYIIFTSGTAGRPRGVVHAHRAIWARRMMWDGWYGLTPEDRVLHAGAFNWTYTLGTGLMDPWSRGATALIPAEGTPHDALPGLLGSHDATIFAAAPGVYRRLLAAGLPPLPELRHGLSAGEKLPEPVRQGWRDATGTEIFEAYGMTECSTFISSRPGLPAPPGALGTPQVGRRVAILDDAGAPVPVGEAGTIAVATTDPGLMLGYLGEDAPAGPWFPTGDQGVMDAAGEISYLGRADDMMNAGGYRVSPLEVEAALSHAPGIEEIAVTEIGVKADTTVIAAFYTGPGEIPQAQLERYAAERLARYKCPRLYRRVAALPRNPNGKIQRRALRTAEEAHHGQT